MIFDVAIIWGFQPYSSYQVTFVIALKADSISYAEKMRKKKKESNSLQN